MQAHPYYPPNMALRNYAPNTKSPLLLIAIFASLAALLTYISWWILAFLQPRITTRERWTATWFVMCGFLHMGFEGYFVRNYREIAGQQAFWAQLWKEYTLSDSRYLLADPQVICLEVITVFVWGPLCFVTAFWTARRDPRQLIMQTVVSMAHLYGCSLYYATSLVDMFVNRKLYSRPEPLYFWGYFIGMNAPFILVPAFIIYLALSESKIKEEHDDEKKML